MRRSGTILYKVPKNTSVAPRFDIWNEKYEPWAHMKRMGRLVGTGFYIPPEWYQHFRMFPPINHNFQQEKTLNPQDASEPTQDDRTTTMTAERLRLRDELGRKSRALASEGMRYYNLFWVQKPLDTMERQYFRLKRQGIAHDIAVKKVLQEFYDSLAVKQRISHIQAEEAKLSGNFITMREATTVLNVLSHIQREQLTPHQVGVIAEHRAHVAHDGDVLQGTVEKVAAVAAPTSATTAKTAPAPAASSDETSKTSSTDNSAAEPDVAAAEASSAEALDSLLQQESVAEETKAPAGYTVRLTDSAHDSLSKLREAAKDNTGEDDWYGMGLFYDTTPPPTGTSSS